MALVVADRVQETSTTSGTGTLTLAGAVAGFQDFSTAIGNGNTTFYTIYDPTVYDWEVGIGTVGAGTLARTTVLSNSAGTTSPISFAGNVKSVFCTYPAEKSINYDADGVATIGETLSYSDTGIIGSFASTVAGYNQVVIQNKSAATNASTNLNVSNDVSTGSAGYVELGINSSTFTGSGSFNIPSASYLASASTDITVGTYGAYNVHFVTNSSTTDAMTIFNSGGVSLGGYGDPGIGTLYANNVYVGFTTITAAASTTVLTNASAGWQNVVGITTQSIQLPDATTLFKGFAFTITSSSTGAVTIKDDASTTIDTVVTGGSAIMVLTDNATVAGTWKAYSYLPSSYDFNTTSANFGNATITNALWNGTTIGTGYGGTGLTTFAAANNAIYSTSSSALAAGTLPVAAGGSGAITFTANGVLYGDSTNPLSATAAGTTGQVLIGNTGAAPSWGTISSSLVSSFQTSLSGLTPSTATTGAVTLAGTLGPTSGGTGLSAYTTGDIIYASATNTLSALADVATGNALISGGVTTAPSWGKIGLATHVSGTLGVANGGTGQTTYTDGQLLIGNSTGNTLTKATLTQGSGITITNSTGSITVANASPMTYPGTGIPNSTGSAWGTSYTTTGSGTVVALATAPTFTTSIDGGATFSAFASSTALTIGSTATGASSTTNIATAALSGAFTKAINIGTGGTTSSTTTINMGSATNGSTIIRGSLAVGSVTANTTDGAIWASNNITAFAASDIKFKENVRDIPNAVEKVKMIGGKLFDWSAQYIESMGGEHEYFLRKSDAGVIAQDVEKAMPELVRARDDGSLAVDYPKLVALAFAAIKELKAEIDELKGK